MINVTFKEIVELNTILSKCVNVGLSIDGLLSIIDIKEEVSANFSKYKEALGVIIKEFNIPINEEGLVINGLNKQEINSKMLGLLNTSIELSKHNTLQKEDFAKICMNLSLNQIEILNKYLRSK